jgi:uncharacterized protein (TIGR00369 family)
MAATLNEHLALTPPAAAMLGREIVAIDADTGVVELVFFAKPEFANRHGSVQGGLVSAMLDSATSVALLAQLPSDLTSVTVELTTAFVKPAPLGRLSARAWVVKRDDRDAEARGELHAPEGLLVAHATARLRIRRRERG